MKSMKNFYVFLKTFNSYSRIELSWSGFESAVFRCPGEGSSCSYMATEHSFDDAMRIYGRAAIDTGSVVVVWYLKAFKKPKCIHNSLDILNELILFQSVMNCNWCHITNMIMYDAHCKDEYVEMK